MQHSAENNLQLTVIGRSSVNYKADFPQHTYEDAIPFADMLKRMSKARYVAHNSPGFERGLHERVVVPLSMGTLVVSETPFVQDSFIKGSIQKISTVNLQTNEEYQQVSEDSQVKVLTDHTWKVRWEKLLNNIN